MVEKKKDIKEVKWRKMWIKKKKKRRGKLGKSYYNECEGEEEVEKMMLAKESKWNYHYSI